MAPQGEEEPHNLGSPGRQFTCSYSGRPFENPGPKLGRALKENLGPETPGTMAGGRPKKPRRAPRLLPLTSR